MLSVLPLDGEAAHAPFTLDLVHATPDADGLTCGFSFGKMGPAAYAALADLMYGDPDAMLRFQQKRRAHKNLFSGSLRFLYWGVTEPVRAFSYLRRKPVVAIATATPIVAIEPMVATSEMSAVVATVPAIVPAMPAAAPVVAMDAALLAIADTIVAPVVEEDFDALAATLAVAPVEAPIVPADWMQAMLRLAAADLQRALSPVETADAATSLAA